MLFARFGAGRAGPGAELNLLQRWAGVEEPEHANGAGDGAAAAPPHAQQAPAEREREIGAGVDGVEGK